MNRNSLVLPLVLVSMTALGVAGCASDTSDAGGSSNEAVRGEQLPAVRADQLPTFAAVTVDFTKDGVRQNVTVASAKKRERILAALSERSASTPIPQCSISPAAGLSFLDENGKEVAKGTYGCAGIGTITPNEGDAILIKANAGAIEKVLTDALVPADVLFGVTKVEIEKRGLGAVKKGLTGAAAAQVIAAYREEAESVLKVEDPTRPGPHCLPNRHVTFFQARKKVAESNYTCSRTVPEKAWASFTIYDANEVELQRGVLEVKAQEIEAVFPASAR